MIEGKLAVLRFQIKIKDELEAMASSSEVLQSTSNSVENGIVPEASSTIDANVTREKAKELSSDLKSITQLYNEYAVPFKLWEVLLYLSDCVCRFVQPQIFLIWLLLLTLIDNEQLLGVLQRLLNFSIESYSELFTSMYCLVDGKNRCIVWLVFSERKIEICGCHTHHKFATLIFSSVK